MLQVIGYIIVAVVALPLIGISTGIGYMLFATCRHEVNRYFNKG
ncbi:hypothetical protein [Aerococcus vaginalis]